MKKTKLFTVDRERLYPIWYNEFYGIIAGQFDGRPTLIKFRRDNYLVLSFTQSGELESTKYTSYATSEVVEEQDAIKRRVKRTSPIQVKQFFLEAEYIGIQPFPSVIQDVLDDPVEYDDEEEESQFHDLEMWLKSGQFVLHWSNEYYLSSEGHVVAS